MLFIFEKKTEGSSTFGFIEFDAVLTEQHNDSAAVTEHPVESGEPLSDYVNPGLSRLSVEAFVTNTPIRSNQLGLLTGEQAVAPLRGDSLPYSLSVTTRNMTRPATVNGGIASPYQPPGFRIAPSPINVTPAIWTDAQSSVGGNSLQFPNRVDRVREIYQALRELQQSGTPVRVISDLVTYPVMAISAISAPKEAQDAIRMTIELTQVVYAATRSVTTARRAVAKTKVKAAVDANKGTSSGDDVSGTYADDVIQDLNGSTVANVLATGN